MAAVTPAHTTQWREGSLKKAGGVGGKQQQQRWFELRGTTLWYYSEPPRGSIDVSDPQLTVTEEGKLGWRLHGPRLEHPYSLSAADEGDRAGWLEAIRRSREDPGVPGILQRCESLDTERSALLVTQQQLAEEVRTAEQRIKALEAEMGELRRCHSEEVLRAEEAHASALGQVRAAGERERARAEAAEGALEAARRDAEAATSAHREQREAAAAALEAAEEKAAADLRASEEKAAADLRASEEKGAELRAAVLRVARELKSTQGEVDTLRAALDEAREGAAAAAAERAEERGRLRGEHAQLQQEADELRAELARERHQLRAQQEEDSRAAGAREAALRQELSAAREHGEQLRLAGDDEAGRRIASEEEMRSIATEVAELKRAHAAQLREATERAEAAEEEAARLRKQLAEAPAPAAGTAALCGGDLAAAIAACADLVGLYDDWDQGGWEGPQGSAEAREAVAAAAGLGPEAAAAQLAAAASSPAGAVLARFARFSARPGVAPAGEPARRPLVLPTPAEDRGPGDWAPPRTVLLSGESAGAVQELAACLANCAHSVGLAEGWRYSIAPLHGDGGVLRGPGLPCPLRLLPLPDIAALAQGSAGEGPASLEAALDACGGAPAALCIVCESADPQGLEPAAELCGRLLPGRTAVWRCAIAEQPAAGAPAERSFCLPPGALWAPRGGAEQRARWGQLRQQLQAFLAALAAAPPPPPDRVCIWQIVHPQGVPLTRAGGAVLQLPCGGALEALGQEGGVLRVVAPARGTVPLREPDGTPYLSRAPAWEPAAPAAPVQWARGAAAEVAIVRRGVLCGWAPCRVSRPPAPGGGAAVAVLDCPRSRCLRAAQAMADVEPGLLRARDPEWAPTDVPQEGHSSSGAAYGHPPGEGCDQGRLDSQFAWVGGDLPEGAQPWYQLQLPCEELCAGVVLRGCAGNAVPGVTAFSVATSGSAAGEDWAEVAPPEGPVWRAPEDEALVRFDPPRLCRRVMLRPVEWPSRAPALRCGLLLDRPREDTGELGAAQLEEECLWQRQAEDLEQQEALRGREQRAQRLLADTQAAAERLQRERDDFTAVQLEMARVNGELRAAIASLRESGEMTESKPYIVRQGPYPHPLVGLELSPDMEVTSASPALPAGRAGVPVGGVLVSVAGAEVSSKAEAVKAVAAQGQREFTVLVAQRSVAPSVAGLQATVGRLQVELQELKERLAARESEAAEQRGELERLTEQLAEARAAAPQPALVASFGRQRSASVGSTPAGEDGTLL
eukprot:TRINITY_DN24220_c1_g1_i2.p1 TRINITY_DN24220_c1_g1~~TRINITY_DN24220_c1_g1_i2.p1  ORF type:complete len:1255 (+),score=446.58 TRINITY_DN24220_c1_g1_i2:68-3832(+)